MFRRMNTVIDNMEALLIEAQKAKGWKWVDKEPMWLTWSLEKIGKENILSSLQPLTPHQLPSLPVSYRHTIVR